MNFHQFFKKCSILTPDIRKQPQTSLESIKKAQCDVIRVLKIWPIEGAMYITQWQNFGGHPKLLVLCNFFKMLMVSDKMIHRAFRTATL